MSTHPIFDDVLKTAAGAASESPEQPPVDNAFVKEGCEKFSTYERPIETFVPVMERFDMRGLHIEKLTNNYSIYHAYPVLTHEHHQ